MTSKDFIYMLKQHVSKNGVTANDLVSWAEKNIPECECIMNSIAANAQEATEEVQRHKQAMLELNTIKNVIQRACKHPITTYYGDPSGGRDSHTECNICGAQF